MLLTDAVAELIESSVRIVEENIHDTAAIGVLLRDGLVPFVGSCPVIELFKSTESTEHCTNIVNRLCCGLTKGGVGCREAWFRLFAEMLESA